MQNTTTQTQTFYTKPSMPGVAPQPTSQAPVPKKSGKNKLKQILAVAGVVLFLVVAIMGVLIAQRQLAKPGEEVTPVAPTAPESRPEAVVITPPNNCVVTFTVPSPLANCTSKVALTNFTSSGGTSIPAGTKFNVNDEFVFSLTISQPSLGTLQNVKITDTLPASLTYVGGPTNPPYTLANNGQIVTATIPTMGPNSTAKAEFKVRVNSASYSKSTNSANVINATGESNICSYQFEVVQGVVECVDKTLYDLAGTLIPNGGALDRGKEYEYRVTAKATNQSLGEVKVHDVLPKELVYVGPATGSEKYITNDPKSGLLIANFGIMKDQTKTLGFIVRVPNDIAIGEFTNIAKVYAFPPTSKQVEPPSNADECSISQTILAIGTAECISKEAYTDFAGTKIAPNTEIEPGDEFVYKVTVTAEQTTTGPVTIVDALPQDLTFIQDTGNTDGVTYNASTREVSATLGTMQTGQTKVIQFKVQLSADPQNESFTNVAIITTNSDAKHTCEIPLKIEQPTYSCNSPCDTNANCTTIGDDYLCYDSGDGKFCRLESNPTYTSCQTATPTPTPTPTPTGTPTPTPTPTPAPGCNELCVQNADCSNTSHICVSTDDGSMRCRLADYPTSTTCTVPGTPIAEQPVLPTELPQTGPADWLNWLKAGLVTLGIGTALFLLL